MTGPVEEGNSEVDGKYQSCSVYCVVVFVNCVISFLQQVLVPNRQRRQRKVSTRPSQLKDVTK